MANDYIPRGEAEFNGWLSNFVTYANANLAGLGLALDTPRFAPRNPLLRNVVRITMRRVKGMTPVTTAQTTWSTNYPAHIAAQAAAISAREGKDAARTGVETAVRPLVRRLQASPSVDDTERAALGITVPDKEPSPVGPPPTRPVVTVEGVPSYAPVCPLCITLAVSPPPGSRPPASARGLRPRLPRNNPLVDEQQRQGSK